jgi:hypothetical protein
MSDSSKAVTSEQRCANCGLSIRKSDEDGGKDWRHIGTGSIFCKKKRGMTLTEAAPAKSQHRPSAPQDRDWPEDFEHENGNYICRCVGCKQLFVGHKRRVECKVCAAQSSAPQDESLRIVRVNDEPWSDEKMEAFKPVSSDSGKGFEEWFAQKYPGWVKGLTYPEDDILHINALREKLVRLAAWNAALESRPAPEGEECPFCGENHCDLIGLKIHLQDCASFNAITLIKKES